MRDFNEAEVAEAERQAAQMTPMQAMVTHDQGCACVGAAEGMTHCRCIIRGAAESLARQRHIKTHNTENPARDCEACRSRFKGLR